MNIADLIDVEGKVVVVTGAGSGIGQSIAVGLAGLGAKVHALDASGKYLDETEAQASAEGTSVRRQACDVTDEHAVIDAFARVRDVDGPADVVFANAGIGGPVVPVEDLTASGWRETMAVNLDGVFFTAREAVRAMKPRRRGKIIITSSVWGLRGTPDGPFTAYAASKGAVVNLTRQLAVDLAPVNINVNGIAPAGVRTRVGDNFYENQPDAVEKLRSRIPSGKIVGPEAVLGAAVFLASAASDHVNGHVLAVDGGYMAA